MPGRRARAHATSARMQADIQRQIVSFGAAGALALRKEDLYQRPEGASANNKD